MEAIEIFVICFSVVSCLFSLCVIGTIFFFRKMQAGNFLPLILYMSISDLGMNFVSAFGYPADGSALCWIQGILATYFTITGWFWTTMLAYRVYSMVRYGKCNITIWTMYAIAWGFPAFLTLIPLSTTNYGRSEGSLEWCLFTNRGNHPVWLMSFWSFSTFFSWLFICIGLMVAWQVIISFKFKNSSLKPVIKRTYDKVYLYPVAMVLCWSLNLICDDSLGGSQTPFLAALSMIIGISNGILSALIFMVKSEEAQRRWHAYLFPEKQSDFDHNVEPPIRLDFEDDDNEELMTEYSLRMSEYTNRNTNVSMVGKMSDMTRDVSFVASAHTSTSNPMNYAVGNNQL